MNRNTWLNLILAVLAATVAGITVLANTPGEWTGATVAAALVAALNVVLHWQEQIATVTTLTQAAAPLRMQMQMHTGHVRGTWYDAQGQAIGTFEPLPPGTPTEDLTPPQP